MILGTSLAACSKNSNNNNTTAEINNQKANIALIIAALDSCPNWVGVSKDDLEIRRKITTIYKSLQKYDNATIRGALDEIMSAKILTPEARDFQDGRTSKAFALLRVLFDIPQGFLPVLPDYYGISVTTIRWGDAYHEPDSNTVNLLWPFDLIQGNLVLVGVGSQPLIGSGPGYNPIYEFDEMVKIYKRRDAK